MKWVLNPYTNLCLRAFTELNLRISNINYDTTSKVMWGEYETLDDEKVGVVKIEFDYSKDRRPDKKQIKMALGVFNGVVVDANVINDSKDDHTFYVEKLEKAKNLPKSLSMNVGSFHYITDSAFFTKENSSIYFFRLCARLIKKIDALLLHV